MMIRTSFISFFVALFAFGADAGVVVDLTGTWEVELEGAKQALTLPGTLADAGLGHRWTRAEFESTTDRPQSGALTCEYQYLGKAVYRRTVELSEADCAEPLELMLERVMWTSRVTFDGRLIGECESLSTPHVYALGKVAAGRHELAIEIDNSCRHGFSRNAHSYGPSCQSVWNGVIGRIQLRSVDPFAKVKIEAKAPSGGSLTVRGLPPGYKGSVKIAELPSTVLSRAGDCVVLKLDREPDYWSALSPRLYTLVLGEGNSVRRIRFGFHSYSTSEQALLVNGKPIFLRANIDNCIFPKTGRPAMTKAEWLAILRPLKEEDGFNAIRFHTWCPPEAAWEAADELGMYFQPEACVWSDNWMQPKPQHVGWGESVDGFVRHELRAICDAYGNHPSFLSLATGNELGGSNWTEAERIVGEMRRYEPRILHCFTCARKILTNDQYAVCYYVKDIGMFRGRVEAFTDWDYESSYSKIQRPTIAHEIGQWPMYPDFDSLLPKFDGVMRPWNIDRCVVRAKDEGADRFSREYRFASARQSRLLYKDEVESFLRTPSCAGIQVLDAQDYTGQGEALMGWRDPFYALKAEYRSLPAFRTFWAEESGLARFSKYNWCVGETYTAKLQIRNQTAKALPAGQECPWSIIADDGSVATQGVFRLSRAIEPGALGDVGEVRYPISRVGKGRWTLRFRSGAWPFWTFPNEAPVALPSDVLATADFAAMREALAQGRTVLYTGKSRETASDQFRPVYWSAVWFKSRQPLKETLGTWFEKDHPMLAGFPTDSALDWQWYDLVNGAKIHLLTGLSREFRPVALSVNDFHFSMLSSPLFELKVGKGRLVVCGYDLEGKTPPAKRLRSSIFEYLKREPASVTVSVPLSWLDESFAPRPEVRRTEGRKGVYSQKFNLRCAALERELPLEEPVTGEAEITFDSISQDGAYALEGSLDGHDFSLPLGKGLRKVKVQIIREDVLDGKLKLSVKGTGGVEAILCSVRISSQGE